MSVNNSKNPPEGKHPSPYYQLSTGDLPLKVYHQAGTGALTDWSDVTSTLGSYYADALIQCGIAVTPNLSSSGDSDTVTITFPTTFATGCKPLVFVTTGADAEKYFASAGTITITGFVGTANSPSLAVTAPQIKWLAIGKRPSTSEMAV